MRLDDSRDLPGVAGHLERDVVVRPEALREQLERLRCRLDPAGRAHFTVLDQGDLAEVAVDVQPNCSHLILLASWNSGRTGGQNDIDGFALAAQPGKSQGRPLESSGSKPIVR